MRRWLISGILVLCCLPALAQVSYTPYTHTAKDIRNDKKLVTRYLKLWNDTLEYHDKAGMMTKFTEGYIRYSPDDRFRFLVLKEDYCGAYCNTEAVTYICYKTNGQEMMQRVPVSFVTGILSVNNDSLPDYLVMTSYGVRPRGVETIEYEEAWHLRLSEKGIELIPFSYRHVVYMAEDEQLWAADTMDVQENSLLTARSVFCWEQPEDMGIWYNADSLTLQFYSYQVLETADTLYCLPEFGKLYYRNGSFNSTP